MMMSQSQGEIGIECQLAGISRSGYYRHWQLSAPRREETGLHDAIQRLALKHRHYGSALCCGVKAGKPTTSGYCA
jgi:putative transposase